MSITIRINLSKQIQKWREARKGGEVRQANIEAFEMIQTHVNDAIDAVNQASTDVVTTTQTADTAVFRANTTLDRANTVLDEATVQATNSADSATLSKSWTEGGTGSRPGEDTNNSEYHSQQSKTAAEKAKNEANRASMYADFVTPEFLIVNNQVYIKEKSTVDFKLFDNRIYMKLPA